MSEKERCGNCGEESQAKKRSSKFCSKGCADKAHSVGGSVQTVCNLCGMTFRTTVSQVEAGRGVFCSKECKYKALSLQYSKVIERVCGVCGKTFEAQSSAIRKGNGRFCSAECAQASRRRKPDDFVNRTCEACGKEMLIPIKRAEQGRGRFCSKACTKVKYNADSGSVTGVTHANFSTQELVRLYVDEGLSAGEICQRFSTTKVTIRKYLKQAGIEMRGRTEAIRLRVQQGKDVGENHSQWKGKRITRKGYVFLHQPNHPRSKNGRVQEHIVVWEQAHGRPLPKSMCVHHLNGIKSDNRPENLYACTNSEHQTVHTHGACKQRIRELEERVCLLEKQLTERIS